jgi:hypothetical protein
MAPRSRVLAVGDGTFVVEVGTGPMKGHRHSRLEFEVSRELHLN